MAKVCIAPTNGKICLKIVPTHFKYIFTARIIWIFTLQKFWVLRNRVFVLTASNRCKPGDLIIKLKHLLDMRTHIYKCDAYDWLHCWSYGENYKCKACKTKMNENNWLTSLTSHCLHLRSWKISLLIKTNSIYLDLCRCFIFPLGSCLFI